MPETVRAAEPADFDALIRLARAHPYYVAQCRTWRVAALAEAWGDSLVRGLPQLMGHPRTEVLLSEEDGAVKSFALLQHELEEGATGEVYSLVRPPSCPASPTLLAAMARRASARGSVRLSVEVGADDARLARACEAAGLGAEYQRIVRPLAVETQGWLGPSHPPSAEGEARSSPKPRTVWVRHANASDQLFLMALCTECVPFMFHARRRGDIERVRERFFGVYAGLRFDDQDALLAYVALTADGAGAGAVLVAPHGERMFDDGWQAYIYDISVLPEYWGHSVASTLIQAIVDDLTASGIAWLAGDISTDNQRVQVLAERFGFEMESRRYFKELKEI